MLSSKYLCDMTGTRRDEEDSERMDVVQDSYTERTDDGFCLKVHLSAKSEVVQLLCQSLESGSNFRYDNICFVLKE